MARKSRKDVIAERITERKTGDAGSHSASWQYQAGIYARLSIEDNGGAGDSIGNQIQIVEDYIRQQKDLKWVETFIDNGQTGTNFQRPGFLALMEAVKTGRVNCIVVKDDCVIIERNTESPEKCGFCGVCSVF